MHLRSSLLLIAFMSIGSIPFIEQCFSQKAPIKFGKVDISLLEMSVYEPDSSAEAGIICDYGVLNGNTFTFTRIIRIKILKKEGYHWANGVFPSRSIAAVKARTYNLKEGKVVFERLRNESVFNEKVTEGYYRTRFSMPNVQVGSVLEIMLTFFGPPIEWRFQQEIPVIWSELRMTDIPGLKLRRNYIGYEPLYIASDHRWVGKDMPAFKSEQYIDNPSNYITKFDIDILEGRISDFVYYFGTWNSINDFFISHDNFGLAAAGFAGFLTQDVKEISVMNISDEDKIKVAVERIKDQVKWDGTYRVYANLNLGYIYRNKKIGTSADINFLLLLLLRDLGFDTYPVLLSTRDNGILRKYTPTLEKFNNVIVSVRHNDKESLLDATDKNVPAFMLPENCINGPAWRVDKSIPGWVEFSTEFKDVNSISGELEILESGEITGMINYERRDYGALRFREKYEASNSINEYLNVFEEDHPGTSVNDFHIENKDSIYRPVRDSYEVTINNKANIIGEQLYFEPMIFLGIEENPFKPDERKYPVDFTVPSDKLVLLKYTIPDGYQVDKIPEPLIIVTPDRSAEYLYSVNQIGDMIHLTCKMKINDPVIIQTSYLGLREFYNQIVAKENEPVILKKI